MRVSTAARWLLPSILASLLLSGCSLILERFPEPDAANEFPDVIGVELRPVGDRVFDVAVTISSPYDTPERYADGWRVLDQEGNVLGTHMLLHDHANEQPFTRVQRGLHVPTGIDEVTVEGRDQANGYGGQTLTVAVPE